MRWGGGGEGRLMPFASVLSAHLKVPKKLARQAP